MVECLARQYIRVHWNVLAVDSRRKCLFLQLIRGGNASRTIAPGMNRLVSRGLPGGQLVFTANNRAKGLPDVGAYSRATLI